MAILTAEIAESGSINMAVSINFYIFLYGVNTPSDHSNQIDENSIIFYCRSRSTAQIRSIN